MAEDIFEIKKELVNFLRNSDIISVANRGVTTQTDTGTYSGNLSDTLDTNPTQLHNIRSIVVAGSTLKYGTDYTYVRSTGVITYTSAQTGAYTISYDTGTTDSIFPNFPQANLKLSAFPRIAVDIIGGNMNDIDLGATTTHHTYNITIVAYSTTVEELEDMISSILSNMLTNKKLFYYITYVKPDVLGPIINAPGKGDKVVSRSIDFKTLFNYQTA